MSKPEPSSAPLRLFIAVRCPASPGLRRVLDALEAWRPAVKPVAADDLHLTLRFLGDTPADRVPALAGALDRAVAAAGVGPFAARWAQLGRFPADGRKPVRVIHVTPVDSGPFDRLAAAIEAELDQLEPAIVPASRPFHAHLTLARVKVGRARSRGVGVSGRQVEAFFEGWADTDLGSSRIKAVELIASELTPRGPIHRRRHQVPLIPHPSD